MVRMEHLIHAGIIFTVTFCAQVSAQSAEQSQRNSGKSGPCAVDSSGCQATQFRGDSELVTTDKRRKYGKQGCAKGPGC